jgi:E3 ubiquitin-protein ligase MUL1
MYQYKNYLFIFRSDQKRIIKEAYNVIRFMIQRGNMEVEIIDPLSAEILDLDTIHDKFESSSLGIMDHVVGFFNGVRPRGVETTEEFLKEGTVITGNFILYSYHYYYSD